MKFARSSTPSWHQHLVDDMVVAYVEWREACPNVRAAYDRWARARPDDEMLAFGAYQAALDTEERASQVYADHVRRVRVPARS